MTPEGPNEQPTKPDWVISNLNGQVPDDVNEMRKTGDFVNAFDLKQPDEYWKLPEVKQAFTDQQGGEQRAAFDDYYKNLKKRFEVHTNTELNLNNLEATLPNAYAKKINAFGPRQFTLKANPDPYGRAYLPTTGYTEKQRGIRETAIETGVRLEDGSYVRPSEFDGYAKFATESDGSFKLNEGGSPFLEPVRDDEELKSYEQVYNNAADWWGYYGHDYDSKQILSFLPKNLLSFFSQTIDSLAEFPKSILGALGQDKSDAYKTTVGIENWAKSIDFGTTEKGQDFFSVENLTNLGFQVAGQLAAMWATGGATAAITGSEAAGSVAGRLFMTGISAGEISEVSRENNLSYKEQLTLLGIYSAALYGIAGLDEAVIKGFNTQGSKAAFRDMIAEHAVKIKQAANSKSALLATMKDADLGIKSLIYKMGQSGIGSYAAAAGGEALEESAEAVTLTGLKAGFNQYNSFLDSGEQPQSKFNIDWLQEAQNVGYSAVGGAIGGLMAKKLFNAIGVKNPELKASIEDMIADGKEKVLYNNLEKYKKEGRLGLTWRAPDGTLAEGKISENDAAFNVIKSVIDYNVELRDSLGLDALKELNNKRAGEEAQYVKLSSIGKDASRLGSEITNLEAKLVDQAKADPETIKQLTDDIEIKRKKLSDIVNGNAVDDYIAEGAFNFTTLVGGKSDSDVNFKYLNGKSFVELFKSIPSIMAMETTRATEELKILQQADDSATLDKYEGASQIGKTRVLGEAKVGLHELIKQHSPDINQALGFEPDDTFLMDMSHNPEELQANLQSITEGDPEIYNDAIKKKAADLMLESAKVQALEAYNPVPTPKIPKEEDFYRNMIEKITPLDSTIPVVTTTPVPISEMIQKELQLENDSKIDGVSIYMNTPQIEKIIESIRARVAQLKGVLATRAVLPAHRATFVKPPLEANQVLQELKGMEAEATRLLRLSEDNANSSDLRIKQVTIQVIHNQLRNYQKFAEIAVSKPEFQGVRDILKNYQEAIYKAVTSNDVDGMLRNMMKLESDTFDAFSENADSVLQIYEEAVPNKFTLSSIKDSKYQDIISSYDYIRGVLAVKASRVMSAFEQVVNNAQGDLSAVNQDVVARAAVHSLMGDKYSPGIYSDVMQKVELSNSVMVHSEGGAGKTSQVIPLIVGMMQQIDRGRVFLTSKNNDGGRRITNLRKAIRQYYTDKNSKIGVKTMDTDKDILEFLQDGTLTNQTDLIVYDEATLLTFQELSEIKKQQDKINTLRKKDNRPLLKILYAGDTYQNNANTNKANADTETNGIGADLSVRVPKTPELSFSFRSLNQSLKLFNDFVRSSQFQAGYPKQVAIFEYGTQRGVRIFHEKGDFENHVVSQAKELKDKGEIAKAIYITDKNLALLSPEILNAGMQVMTSEAAQGNEWDYVFFDPSNNNLFAEGARNIAIKKDFYTASTRAKKYFVTSMPKEQMISSRQGTVYDLKPLSAEKNDKTLKLESISKILEGSREDLGNSPMTYSGGDYNVGPTPSELFPTGETSKPSLNQPTTVIAPETRPDISSQEGSPIAEKFADFLSGAAYQDSGKLPLYTFFTPAASERVDQVDLKKKAIYDTKGQIGGYQYFVTIAKIGTEQYHNVVHPDSKDNGTYAAFIEAFVDGDKTIIGVLPNKSFGRKVSLDSFISQNNLLGDNDVISFKINSDLILNAEGKAPVVFNVQKKTSDLGNVKSKSPNVNFGNVGMFTASDNSYEKGRGGKAFLPTSFVYSSDEIERILSKGLPNDNISFIQLSYKKIPFEEAASILRQYIVDNKYAFSDEGKNMYYSFWGNMTKHFSDSRDLERFKPISAAFADILEKVDVDSDYYKHLLKYARPNTNAKPLAVSDATKELIRKEPEVAVKDKSYFFMADYLVANKTDLPLFQRAISDLYAHPSYKEGFRFDLQLARNSTEASARLFSKAMPIPEEYINKYLQAEADYISMPVLKLDSKSLAEGMVRSKPDVVPSPSTVVKQAPVETGPFPNEVIPETNYDVEGEFEKNDPKSLIDFKDRFFPGADVVHMRPTIDLFRRTLFDKLFMVKNVEKPVMNNINKTIADYQQELDDNFQKAQKFGHGFDNDANTLRRYNLVIRANFDFLLGKYFPVISKKGSSYSYQSNHWTDQSWFDKENYSHIHQGMTEMSKMLLFNTPMVTTQNGKLRTTGRHLNFSDIEEVINELKDGTLPTTSEEFARKMSPNNSFSDVTKSLYYRYFSPSAVEIDGIQTHSLRAITDPEVWKMLDAFQSFFMSGQPYALASVNLATGKNNTPVSVFGTPNLIRQHGYDSMNAQMKSLGKNIIYGNSTVRLDGETWFKSAEMERKGTPYTAEQTIRAMQLIGLPFFSVETLTDLTNNGLVNLDVTPGKGVEQRVINRLIDNVFFETAKKFVDANTRGLDDVDDSVITAYTNAIFKSVARRDGMNNILMYVNLDGKRVYRLRNTAPIFTLNDKIAKARLDNNSPIADNSFVNGDFTVRTAYVKEGFQDENNGKVFTRTSRELSPNEMFELDFFWGFLNELDKSYKSTGQFKSASFPVMAYSDGSTIMDLIVDKKDGYMGSLLSVVKKSFDSQQQFYVKIARDILTKWHPHVSAQSIQGLKTLLDRAQIPTEQVEQIPGMIVNRDYADNNGFATIKQTLIDQMEIFQNMDTYITKLDENFDRLKKSIRPKAMDMLVEKIKDTKSLSKFTPETLLKSFYIHWVAISNDIQLLTNGEISNFKGKSASAEYIEMVKRAKSELSTHNTPIFRNESWKAQVQQHIASSVASDKSLAKTKSWAEERPDLFYEGHKLNKQYNVAFVHDPVRFLTSISGETKQQEVYDGATFVTPLTRIYQRYSNGHEHGMLTPPVMKNITTYYDAAAGNKMFIKNAEFEITPEIMQNGTPRILEIVKKMLGPAFNRLTALGVNPDLSNVTYDHFEQLADELVLSGEQDNIIMELVPSSSVKTGRRATTSIDAPAFIPTTISITSKGAQLDASKDPSDGLITRTPTQLISSMGINWKNPEALTEIYKSLETITDNYLNEYEQFLTNYDANDTAGKENITTLSDKLRHIVRSAIETREGILYANQLVRDDKFSLDDRQILETLVSNFNSTLVDNAISVGFQGGHYVVHPSDGIVEVYDTPRGIKLKSQLNDEEKALQGRPLKWTDPVNDAGQTFSEFRDNAYIEAAADEGFKVSGYKEAAKALPQERKDELAQYFQEELQSGNWKEGEAEILLPADMMNEFMLDPGVSIHQINRLYFAQKLLAKRKNDPNVTKRADEMYKAFHAKLHGVMSRIPNTGKHSAVNTKVVGFMNGSLNAVFVPSMLLFIQGADQDVDKGAYLTYQSVRGILPKLDEDGKLLNPELFSTGKRKGENISDRNRAVAAAYKNKVVDAIRGIMGDVRNAWESNISVDSVMEELKEIRNRRQQAQDYNRYDYTSLSRMINVNQSGKRLVGIFANGLKAYQNLYAYHKISGRPSVLADLDVDFNKVWITFAAFINASTDNAKEQILGTMNINTHNAGIVSYLIATGKSSNEIDQFLIKYKDKLDQMDSFYYYDSKFGFKPEAVWGADSELTTIYKLSQEMQITASAILNNSQSFPKRSGDMYAYKNRIESYIKKAYKTTFNKTIPFSLVKFMNDEAYAQQHIKLYAKLIKDSEFHNLNFLDMIQTVPHLRGYMKTYTTALDVLQSNSRVLNLTNRLADEFRFPTNEDDKAYVNDEIYRDMTDFVYGGLIDLYFKGQEKVIGDYNVATPQGRNAFVNAMNGHGKDALKNTYPNNPFIRSLFVEDARRRGKTVQRLRTYDLSNMEEEKLLEMQVMFHELPEGVRQSLITYSMIVDKNKTGKGSWAQLLEPSDLKDFNDFMNSINPETLEMSTQTYRNFSSGNYDTSLNFNTIPYTFNSVAPALVQESAPPEVRDVPLALSDGVVDILQDVLPTGYTMSVSARTATFDTKMEITRGKVKSYTSVHDYLENLYKGNLPESANLDQDDKKRIKGMLDFYDKRKNEGNFTYDKTQQDMKSCGIKIKAH